MIIIDGKKIFVRYCKKCSKKFHSLSKETKYCYDCSMNKAKNLEVTTILKSELEKLKRKHL